MTTRAHMPPPRGITYVYYHDIQASSPLKQAWSIKAKFYASIEWGNQYM